MINARRILVGLVTAGVMAGCASGSQSPAADPTPASTPTASPSPSPVPLTLAQAKRAYLTGVAEYNHAVRRYNVYITAASPQLAPLRHWAAIAAKGERRYERMLMDTRWPNKKIRQAARTAAVQSASAEQFWRTLARDHDLATFISDSNQPSGKVGTARAVEVLRLMLHLPPAQG